MKTVTIKENHLFEKCYRKGKRWSGQYVTVYLLPDYKSEKYRRLDPEKRRINRIGLTVGKRVGGAVVRSRVRRILREAVRLRRKSVSEAGMTPVRTGFLVVIAAKDKAAGAKTQDIAADLERAIAKLDLYAVPRGGAKQ